LALEAPDLGGKAGCRCAPDLAGGKAGCRCPLDLGGKAGCRRAPDLGGKRGRIPARSHGSIRRGLDQAFRPRSAGEIPVNRDKSPRSNMIFRLAHA
jgi:hypothetical protein